jgi:hypothetical protein
MYEVKLKNKTEKRFHFDFKGIMEPHIIDY